MMTESRPHYSPKSENPSNNFRKYHVIVEAEGADGLQVSSGTEVSFVLKRHGKVSISSCAEVWDDGVVYWDSKCSQVCTLVPEADGNWRPKPCEIQVQAICLDSNGEPVGLGETVATTSLDLANFCAHDSFGHLSEPQRITLELNPSGTLNLHVSSIWLRDWNASSGHDDACSDVSALSLTPAPSTASLCPEESSLTLGGYACDTSTAASSPNPLLRAGEEEEVSNNYNTNVDILVPEMNGCVIEENQGVIVGEVIEGNEDEEEEERQQDQCNKEVADDFEISAALKTPGVSGRQISTTSSDAIGRSNSGASSGSSSGASFTALQRRCRRLARERDEARAESFAEASVAVQRGIEIENLKRAKDMLLQRLETTEMQLMMAMRMDPQGSPSSTSKTSSSIRYSGSRVDEHVQKEGKDEDEEEINSGGQEKDLTTTTTKKKQKDLGDTPSAPYGDSDAVVLALVDAKVSLATKEFEIMELQGQLRAKEAYVDVLTEHLTAVRAAAEERAIAYASTPTTGRGSMRSVWHTPSITPPWSNSPKKNNTAVITNTQNNSKHSSTRASPLGTAVNTMFGRSGNATPTTTTTAAQESAVKPAVAPVVHIVAHAEAAETM